MPVKVRTMKNEKHSFLYRNSLSIVLLVLALLPLAGQIFTGWKDYLDFLNENSLPEIGLAQYLTTGHFLEATFENWESEFLQLALFVILTIFLRQQGSSESKSLDKEEDCDKEPQPHPDSPWPVRKGGWILAVYKHSLSIVLIFLFLISFMLHWYGSWKDNNLHQLVKHKPVQTMFAYLGNHRFWFESLQNWQSEFVSIFGIIVLSIYLRQKGSPQSKAVDTPYKETGK